MVDLYDFYNLMDRHNIMLSFKGEVSSDLLSSILQITESKLERLNEEPRLKKKVYNVLVECLQNLYHHIDEAHPDIDAKSLAGNPIEMRSALMMIGRSEDGYTIMTGNHIEEVNIAKLRNRLDQINAMTKEELKLHYQEVLNNDEYSSKGGGGLGMIDIARKSGHKINYFFQPVNDRLSFFCLLIKIS